MILVKYSKFLSSLFFLQKRPRFCRFMIMFSPNESFWTIKISRYYGRKICIFSKGLTHDSCQKFQLPLETYFSVKETSVFSFDDVVLSKGSFLTIKLQMWEARGVGTYSKTYPGMLGLKCISLPLIILVSETPIMLNSKFNSSNRWTWKFSRFRLRLLMLLRRREKLESLTRLGSSLLNCRNYMGNSGDYGYDDYRDYPPD